MTGTLCRCWGGKTPFLKFLVMVSFYLVLYYLCSRQEGDTPPRPPTESKVRRQDCGVVRGPKWFVKWPFMCSYYRLFCSKYTLIILVLVRIRKGIISVNMSKFLAFTSKSCIFHRVPKIVVSLCVYYN